MKVAIVGYGFVGKAMHRLFKDAVVYDPFVPEFSNSKQLVQGADVAFVCVPTNTLPDGSCDTSIVEDVFTWLDVKLAIIRSTIKPNTTSTLQLRYPNQHIVFQPEYVGETTAHPLLNESERTFLIFGGKPEDTSRAVEVYQSAYNASVKILCVSSLEAEIIKYMENSAIGTMVTFANEFYSICKAFGVPYHMVREGFLMDPRMSRYFTFVYPENRGFSGKCLPKDLNAIVKASEGVGYSPQFIRDMLKNNDRFRGLNPVETAGLNGLN